MQHNNKITLINFISEWNVFYFKRIATNYLLYYEAHSTFKALLYCLFTKVKYSWHEFRVYTLSQMTRIVTNRLQMLCDMGLGNLIFWNSHTQSVFCISCTLSNSVRQIVLFALLTVRSSWMLYVLHEIVNFCCCLIVISNCKNVASSSLFLRILLILPIWGEADLRLLRKNQLCVTLDKLLFKHHSWYCTINGIRAGLAAKRRKMMAKLIGRR